MEFVLREGTAGVVVLRSGSREWRGDRAWKRRRALVRVHRRRSETTSRRCPSDAARALATVAVPPVIAPARDVLAPGALAQDALALVDHALPSAPEAMRARIAQPCCAMRIEV